MKSKNMIAMILVGGRGTRLGEITNSTAKPAVSFGAKYRLIDFTLSNITNSNIDKVGIVTQYEPFDLMDYIGSGASWDLDYIEGGVRFLTPYTRNEGIEWQRGTAHAIKQYFDFIKRSRTRYVLVLSGDHIYKMNYREMLNHHINTKAEITIATNTVSLEEAKRFGVLEANDSDKVISFQEKPQEPKSNLASMGIYIFSIEVLESLLKSASKEENDFGKHIIPKALREGLQVSVYRFTGYWKDVGTIKSLYKANMDLLDDPDFLGLNVSKDLPIYSKSLNLNPHVMLNKAKVTQSVIADGCLINGCIHHSTVAYLTVIESGSCITDCVILPRVKIGYNVQLKHVIVDKDVVIPDNYQCIAKDLTLISKSNLMEVGGVFE